MKYITIGILVLLWPLFSFPPWLWLDLVLDGKYIDNILFSRHFLKKKFIRLCYIWRVFMALSLRAERHLSPYFGCSKLKKKKASNKKSAFLVSLCPNIFVCIIIVPVSQIVLIFGVPVSQPVCIFSVPVSQHFCLHFQSPCVPNCPHFWCSCVWTYLQF